MNNRDNWGWRARFGMFIVSSEVVPEAEWWAMMPPGTSIHAARVQARAPWASLGGNNSPETGGVAAESATGQAADATPGNQRVVLADDLARGAAQFAAMQLNAVVVGHSSSSILGGPGWDDAVVDALAQLLPAQTRVSTNGIDCVAALRACGIQQPLLVFPPWFNGDVIDRGVAYFEAAGFKPSGALHADPGRQWRDLPPEQLYPQGMGLVQDVEYLYRQIRAICSSSADGVMIVGTGFRCVGICNALEQDLQRPVVTANQASLWHCLRQSGMQTALRGYGGLFDKPLP